MAAFLFGLLMIIIFFILLACKPLPTKNEVIIANPITVDGIYIKSYNHYEDVTYTDSIVTHPLFVYLVNTTNKIPYIIGIQVGYTNTVGYKDYLITHISNGYLHCEILLPLDIKNIDGIKILTVNFQ